MDMERMLAEVGRLYLQLVDANERAARAIEAARVNAEPQTEPTSPAPDQED